jgi:hypothetical protein
MCQKFLIINFQRWTLFPRRRRNELQTIEGFFPYEFFNANRLSPNLFLSDFVNLREIRSSLQYFFACNKSKIEAKQYTHLSLSVYFFTSFSLRPITQTYAEL